MTIQQKNRSRTSKLLIALVAVAVVAGVAVESMKSDEQKASQNAALDKALAAKAIVRNCAAAWEKVNKVKMKDPSSLSWDMNNAERGSVLADKKTVQVVSVPYRAKNGFGALTLEKATCEVDQESGSVRRVLSL